MNDDHFDSFEKWCKEVSADQNRLLGLLITGALVVVETDKEKEDE